MRRPQPTAAGYRRRLLIGGRNLIAQHDGETASPIAHSNRHSMDTAQFRGELVKVRILDGTRDNLRIIFPDGAYGVVAPLPPWIAPNVGARFEKDPGKSGRG